MIVDAVALPDFRAVFEAAPGLYLILTPELDIVAASDAYLRATLTRREEILGRGLFEVFPDNPDEPDATGVANLGASLQRVLALRRPDVMGLQKYDVRRPDGGFEEKYWSPLNTPVLDRDGEVAWIIHRVEDVTELVQLKRAGAERDQLAREQQSVIAQLRAANEELAASHRALQESHRQNQHLLGELKSREAHLQSILAAIPDAMVAIDEHGLVRAYSAAAARLFGFTAAEVEGRDISMLMPSPYRHEHAGYLNRYLETGERRIIGTGRVVSGQRRDGSTFPMELTVAEIRLDGGRQFVGFVRDLSERQESERRMHEMQSDLFHVARLSEMGQMASTLAHEINQPLTAIGNYLRAGQRLLAAGELAKAGATVEKALEQIERTGEIIRRMRDFMRKGEGEKRVEQLPKVIEEAIALALVGVKSEDMRTALQFDPRAHSALIDRVQIQQVLVNLVRNAAEAMTEGLRRELIIDTEFTSGDVIQVSVSDTGPGIGREVLKKLFQPFVTTKASGMGVGLWICRSIIEAHGGRLWVEDNPAGGSIFRFTLPGSEAGQPE